MSIATPIRLRPLMRTHLSRAKWSRPWLFVACFRQPQGRKSARAPDISKVPGFPANLPRAEGPEDRDTERLSATRENQVERVIVLCGWRSGNRRRRRAIVCATREWGE